MASKDAFATACIELCTRIWTKLESALQASGSGGDRRARISACPLLELRLELHLILDLCRCERWRSRLDKRQRRFLRSLLNDVLVCLDSPGDEWPARTSIESAQNLLFDVVQDLIQTLDPIQSAPLQARAAS
jgi:hypothetical protein